MAPKGLLLVMLLSIYFSSTLSFIHANRDVGFSVDLIHRDSPKSPFYNPHETHYDRLRKAFRYSVSRVNHFNPTSTSPNQVQADLVPNGGSYLMNISIGTPPTELIAIADTGSDLTWIQCEPCEACYKQINPIFNPKESSSYKTLSCSSKPCESLSESVCNNEDTCGYSMSYGDKSHSLGDLASETLTMASSSKRPVRLPSHVFGCGHSNEGTFEKHASGIIGLGGGSFSLTTQLGSKIGGKFSYCMIPFKPNTTASSKMNFGSLGVVEGEGAVSTPLVDKDPSTFYYLTLEGLSVGDKKLAYKGSSKTNAFGEKGNIIIDSGTTLNLLPSEFYTDVESALKEAIDLEPVEDSESGLSLCYQLNGKKKFKAPPITAHFKGADLLLTTVNTFIMVTEDEICFSMIASPLSQAIYGNIAQTNFLVGYDTEARTVTFKPTDCTTQ
ncbi:hypothetical protein IFM89_011545 [Coptis chinensis]|uniref:Peptidase A1 domain-containing protein n=1 Tax=Coptis chinensis TaxID=261450 RepID=A0A835MCE7_9MAGN|nr:hypothetical protein IFM89_011545 [Coptis chinensis]